MTSDTETSTEAGLEQGADNSAEVVRAFLLALQNDNIDRALTYLAEDAEWINVSLPTVRGKRRIERIFRSAQGVGGGFRVVFHAIASEGDVVLTERTDEINVGRFQHRFWVMGRFEVRDGRIVIWRDSFDWGDLLVGLAQALAGVVWPRLNRRWPSSG